MISKFVNRRWFINFNTWCYFTPDARHHMINILRKNNSKILNTIPFLAFNKISNACVLKFQIYGINVHLFI